MNKTDRKNWTEKTTRLNLNRSLAVGDSVIDIDKNRGIVVKIVPGTSDIDHGAIYVWQSERFEYGADNCEHYSQVAWKSTLRIK